MSKNCLVLLGEKKKPYVETWVQNPSISENEVFCLILSKTSEPI